MHCIGREIVGIGVTGKGIWSVLGCKCKALGVAK